jgi:hypothetical protein
MKKLIYSGWGVLVLFFLGFILGFLTNTKAAGYSAFITFVLFCVWAVMKYNGKFGSDG